MATLLRFGSWRVMLYTRDHGPAHVHVVGPEGRARVALNCPDGPAVPIDGRGIDAATLKQAITLIGNELERLCREWRSIHGNDG